MQKFGKASLLYNFNMEFHISRKSRKKYQFGDSLFSFNGNVIFANFHAARVFAQRMNEKRDLSSHPELAVQAGQVNAMGLIDEILHLVIALYRSQKMPTLYEDIEQALTKKLGIRKLKATLRAFIRDFPPPAVFQEKLTIDEFLSGETDGIPNRAVAIEELLLLWLANQNPAYKPYAELFDDGALREKSAYLEIIEAIKEYFEQQSGFGPDNQNLVEMLRSPAIAAPYSLHGQLDYIRTRWASLLGHYLLKILSSLDLFSEEERMRGFGPGPVQVPVYGLAGELEYERFSPDADWMPNLVLIAKNTYVWLDQLSKHYQRPITRLDQIPDEELNRLAEWGFTGLWLIGLWERSRASARIKQLCGNPEAIASAYSLKDYYIAADLGGEVALENLKQRCWQRGIRLASDMVPNHMAIDSEWVYAHPEWFISLPYSPFPSYTFNWPNLSEDERAEIRIEDHYYDHTDAAVVFKFSDRRKEHTYYIYHGNDGTSMPWNDTAQLNYLDADVREAVIQTILSVARRFPIIRFDAAMTLAKRHFQRLWFPLPGSGCDIPSRSDFGMTQADFDKYMPEEFWRLVVERVAAEVPDTLLLAEAFWLMEGYFVRTLGMHRVYNSAFMNLLRDEDNAKYRQVMKNTLEFDPEILKRFVNFMNNPDEETAANQFGKGDKYFGVCTMMVTMPGLPMFGHGQIEGLREKYGMEYKRAYWDEKPDEQFIERHAWQIFPLLKHRYLFANVTNFYLYDFFLSNGTVDENVFAYSNRVEDERCLVVYHNRFATTSGWVRTSVAFMDKSAGLRRQMDLRQGLGLPDKKNAYLIFRDQLSGLDYIRNCQEIARKGLYMQLDAYRAHVFLDFRVVEDDENESWRKVHDSLNGRGTHDIQTLYVELPLRPLLQPLREIANGGYFNFLLEQKPRSFSERPPEFLINEAEHKLIHLIDGASLLLGKRIDAKSSCLEFRQKIEIIFQAQWLEELLNNTKTNSLREFSEWMKEKLCAEAWLAQICWSFLDCLRQALQMDTDRFLKKATQWRIFVTLEAGLWEVGEKLSSPAEVIRSTIFLMKIDGWLMRSRLETIENLFTAWLKDDFMREFLRVNEFEDKIWFGKESADKAFMLMAFEGVCEILKAPLTRSKRAQEIERLAKRVYGLRKSAESSGYILQRFLDVLK